MRTGTQGSRQHTWEDFLALDEDDLRELVDGELLEIDEVARWWRVSIPPGLADRLAAATPLFEVHEACVLQRLRAL